MAASLRNRLLATLACGGLVTVTACIGTTGSGLVAFRAYASGPSDLAPDATTKGLTFTNGLGWSITLTHAKLHIGALYLNRSLPVSGGQERSCFLPGIYVAQVLQGADIDVLSPALQPFPNAGSGTADPAVTGEVWLTGGRVDTSEDRTAIADVAGTATRGNESMRFEGKITIGKNRVNTQSDPARPGAKPLCGERIVTDILVSITPTDGGSLVVRVDPRAWFANVELGELTPLSATSDLRLFADDSSDQPSENLYRSLRANGSYRFEWNP